MHLDIADLKARFNLDEDILKIVHDALHQLVSERLSSYVYTQSILIAIGVVFLTILFFLFYRLWKIKTKVLPSQNAAPKKYRFRKRDKVIFFGKKMLRKVRSFSKNTFNAAGLGPIKGRGIKKKELMILAKRLLNLKRESQPQLRIKEPPKSFFEADASELDEDPRIPSEVFYLLKSVRVFGHFEKPLFLELCKHMETLFIPAGNFLFKVGDPDNCIYVVQNGKINVYICEQDDKEFLIKEVETGDSIHSLLSLLDFLTGNECMFKTVCARAVVDTTVLKLPASAFRSLFERFPESLVRVVQVIMVRLQRVTFTALHNYLGLSSELINRRSYIDLKALSINVLSSKDSSKRTQSLMTPVSKEIEIELTHGTKSTETAATIPHSVLPASADETDSSHSMSDFEAACIRAGVPMKSQTRSKQSSEEVSSSSRYRPKKPVFTVSPESDMNERTQVILELARKDLIFTLKLQNENLLDGRLCLRDVKAGTTLTRQGDHDACLIFLVTGTITVNQQLIGEESKEVCLFFAQPGEIVGALAVLTGEPSFFTIRAKTESRVVTISKNDFYWIMREQPSVVLNVANTTLSRLTPFVRQIDFALDWNTIEAGRALFKQGDYADCIYIVLTGRLRTVSTLSSGKKEMVGEYGRGELVGIVEVLTQQERITTAMAIRDTEVAKLPSELLNLIKRKHPQVVTRLIRLLGQRIIGSIQNRDIIPTSEGLTGKEPRNTVANLATVAILPASKNVSISNFTLELQHALSRIGPTTRLTSEIVKQWLGNGALDSMNEFRLFSWLGQQEDIHRMILYQCDYTMSRWSKISIRQADCILIVALVQNDPAVGELEKLLDTMEIRAQKELILLHPEDADYPKRTVEWLNARSWCSSHHHIRCPKRVFSMKSSQKIKEMYEQLLKSEPDRMSDMSRLARFLTGTSIGLVLGGGGARGLAHIGIIRALKEANIPIDMVGGTSMGAFIGALWCEERDYTRFVQRAREWAVDMGSIWKKVLDLTYPVASMFTGRSFNRCIEDVFKERQVEDLWLPYFCITTDITNSSMRVHTHGCLWRYVRASMSLSGYLPPLCDPVDGHLLLDGGYINNLPADVMRNYGAQTIFAVDVGSQDETNLANYGDELSGWWLLWKRWNPWASPIKVPDMTEIQSRLAYVSCIRQLEVVKNSGYCEYIRPPIDKFATLQFGAFDEIIDVGYNHGKTLLAGWQKGGLVNDLFKEKKEEQSKFKILKRTNEPRHPQPTRASMSYFTDLAELVSRIEEPSIASLYLPSDTDTNDESEEEDEEVVADEDLETDSDAPNAEEEDIEEEYEGDETEEEKEHNISIESNPVYHDINTA
ncbi:hypothetical protein ACJMK2_037327 [Sinanodonta woodiana]|uniref:lysophospholipase n=1 Tax=Sinanodonta woodiana TaxID=1069815 RepID=A0ABD3WNI3_SINWO